MAKITAPVVVTVVSDLASDKGATEGVVSYALSFKFDGTPEGAERLLASLRKTGVPADSLKLRDLTEGAAGGTTAGSQGEGKLIRAWAAENDIAVGDRGRLSTEVIDAYRAAHSETV